MECQGNRNIKRIVASSSIVLADVHKKSFLVGKMVVIFELVVGEFQVLRLLQLIRQLTLLPLSPNEVGALYRPAALLIRA